MKRLVLSLAAALVAVLVAAAAAEKSLGAELVARHVYSAPWFVLLWGALAAASAAYVVRRRLFRRPAAFLLHAAFAVILAGAFVTWMWGRQGTLHLAVGESAASFRLRDGGVGRLPFAVRLDDFRVERCPGTRAPTDYVSTVTLTDSGGSVGGRIAMNRIMRFRGYRFCQSSYDADMSGATLSVSCDPWGIGITYTGYALLLAAMSLLLVGRGGEFRRLLSRGALRTAALAAALSAAAVPAHAADGLPRTLPRDVADAMGRLYVCYDDRVCPLSTLAKDFTVELCGRASYRGLTPEQVLSGWMFWYDDWKREPMIRIRSAAARERMGLKGRRARLTDFCGVPDDGGTVGRSPGDADRKFALAGMAASGSLLRLFPYADPEDGTVRWASPVDYLPAGLPDDEWTFIRQSMNYVNELVAMRDYGRAGEVFGKMRSYQSQRGGESLPSRLSFWAERVYVRADRLPAAAAALVLTGLAAFAFACRAAALRRSPGVWVTLPLLTAAVAAAVYLAALLGLRWCAGGHPPLSNGFETMQLLALCALVMSIAARRRSALALPAGLLVGGVALAAAAMGGASPRITPLMPVLSSPLLSIHVMLVMAAYALFAFAMLNGAAGLLLCRRHAAVAARLRDAGLVILYPAVFALAAGIFVGAVWANVSWGRYWGWDPKETWALVTMMVYALPLHGGSVAAFRRPAVFHAYCVAAFISVLITWFGVNFIFGGMHSYA